MCFNIGHSSTFKHKKNNKTKSTINNASSICISEDFDDFSDWTNNGTSTDNVASHAGNSIPCRAVQVGDNIISPLVNNPNTLTFFQDASGGGNGNTATVDYRINGGAWITFYSFNVTTAGNTETVDLTNLSGVDLSNETNVNFRFNSSFNSWYLDDVTIMCGATCVPSHTITNYTPTEGPVGTQVTINGSGFTASTTVTLSGEVVTIISQTSTQLVVELPDNISTNTFVVTENSCKLESASAFNVLNTSGSCTSGPSFTDIFISEVTDASSGSLSYIEIYNGTGAAIDLAANNYALRFKNNGGPETDLALVGTLNDGDSFIFATSVGSGCSVPGGDGSYADQSEVFSGINNNDCISLLKNTTIIDVWGICDGSSWIDALGLGSAGYDFQRKAIAVAPNTTFNATDWTIVDFNACNDNYTDIETYEGSLSYPTVTSQPSNVSTCSANASFSINATAGNSGALTYQWYFNDGSSNNWSIVNSTNLPNVTISGETSNNLQLSGNIALYTNYQFYCLVTEDGSCSSASNASQLKSDNTLWNGSSWSNGVPNNTVLAIIDANYNTAINGNITACSIVVNSGRQLTIEGNDSFINITFDIINNGELIIEDKGSVVQIDDSGIYDDSGSSLAEPTIVRKNTAHTNAWYEYTFWSSPVVSTTVSEALPLSSTYRRFWLNAQNFTDSFYEVNNDNTQNPGAGIDNEDDNADDWQNSTPNKIMEPGMGFAATLSPASYTGTGTYLHEFKDDLNTGTITIPVYRNDTELNDNNWNLIGNPYPSAISVDDFFNENHFSINPSGKLEGAIYIWSHALPYSETNNGYDAYNFNINDYACINGTGQTAGGDNNNDGVVDAADIPNRFIPSCQSFFATYSNTPASTTGVATFTNSMRTTTDNDQFFRTNNTTDSNKIWLNLSNDFGLYNQILIGYLDEASNAYDGPFYDAKRNAVLQASMAFYSIVDKDTMLYNKFLIQGKNSSSLTKDESVKLGFKTNIEVATIYTISIDKLEGDFLSNNAIYIWDKYLNTYNNIANGQSYSFSADQTGDFTDRFELVFKTPNSLSVSENELNNNFTIFENNNNLQLNTNSDTTIKSVTIYDTLGKLYFKDNSVNNSTFSFNTSNLSQGMYFVKTTFNNGTSSTKKIIKK